MKFLRYFFRKPTLTSFTILALFIASCNDLPTRFVAPIFDFGLTLPLIDSLITLDQMVQDSALLRKDGLGNLILVQGAQLPVTMIGDSLRLPSMTVNYTSTALEQSQVLDKIRFGNTASIPLRVFYPSLPLPPAKAAIPSLGAGSDYIESPVLSTNDGEYAIFRSATLQIIITNNFPINLEIGTLPAQSSAGFILSTPGQQDIFLPLTIAQRSIPTMQTRGDSTSVGGAIILNISEQRLTQDSRIKAVLRSTGSNGTQVNYDSTNTLRFRVVLQNTSLRQAKVSIAKQTLHFYATTVFTDNAILTEAVLRAFTAQLNLTNTFPVSGMVSVRLPQLHRLTDGMEFTSQFPLSKNQSKSITLTSGGVEYRLTPDSIDLAMNNGQIKELHFAIDVHTDAIPTTAKEVFDENDNFKLSGVIASLGLTSASGISLPKTSIAFSSTVDFVPQGNIDKITFNRLLAKDSYLEVQLFNSAGVSANFSGKATLLDLSGKVLAIVNIPSQGIGSAIISGATTIPFQTTLSIPLGALDIPEFPKYARIEASVTTNTNTPFLVRNQDYFHGTAEVRIPLTLTVSGGNFHKIDSMNVSSEILKRQKKSYVG
ncbi:MAG: hypothetical protein IPM69_10110 [Ignavibacteria bacterium]|nr:hypothetical protein [Ignavibacteria bacterium]